jgi:hypothetical protein
MEPREGGPVVGPESAVVELATMVAVARASATAGTDSSTWLRRTPPSEFLRCVASDALHLVSPFASDRIERLNQELDAWNVDPSVKLEDMLREARPELFSLLTLPFNIGTQVTVTEGEALAPGTSRWIDPLQQWGGTITKPLGHLWTTTWVPTVGSLWLASDAVLDWSPPPEATLWRVKDRVNGPLSVFEVAGPEDWARLCDEFPSSVTVESQRDGSVLDPRRTYVQPHWSSVAHAYEAVHLSWWGLLTASLRYVECGAGWTFLNGWNTEATVWLCDPGSDWTPVEADASTAMTGTLTEALESVRRV